MLLVALVIAAGLTGSAAPRPARAARAPVPAGAAGIVVRHGDGRLLYAYVPLTDERITGAEALQRANFPVNIQGSAGLGAAICKINGEGCDAPREDCFCRSYGDPAMYWQYHTRAADGTWRRSALGAGNRTLRDGDVDGWSWGAGAANLPPVTLAEIAALTGSQQPADSRQSSAVGGQRPATVERVAATPMPVPDTPLPPTVVSTVASAPVSSLTLPTAVPVSTLTVTVPPTARPASATATPVPTPILAARAVEIAPGGTVTPLSPAPPPAAPATDAGGSAGAFALVAGAMVLLVVAVPLLARRRGR